MLTIKLHEEAPFRDLPEALVETAKAKGVSISNILQVSRILNPLAGSNLLDSNWKKACAVKNPSSKTLSAFATVIEVAGIEAEIQFTPGGVSVSMPINPGDLEQTIKSIIKSAASAATQPKS